MNNEQLPLPEESPKGFLKDMLCPCGTRFAYGTPSDKVLNQINQLSIINYQLSMGKLILLFF